MAHNTPTAIARFLFPIKARYGTAPLFSGRSTDAKLPITIIRIGIRSISIAAPKEIFLSLLSSFSIVFCSSSSNSSRTLTYPLFFSLRSRYFPHKIPPVKNPTRPARVEYTKKTPIFNSIFSQTARGPAVGITHAAVMEAATA